MPVPFGKEEVKKMATQPLKKLKHFSNCIFSASLWGSKPHYFVFAVWEDEDGEVQGEKAHKLNATNDEDAVRTYVDIVQQLRRFGKFECQE